MSAEEDRKPFKLTIKYSLDAPQHQREFRASLRQDYAKELLLMKDKHGYLPIHDACYFNSDRSCLQLIVDTGVEHGIAKQMLEEKSYRGYTCLHSACAGESSPDSLRFLFGYLLKHADIKKVLEAKDWQGHTCLHYACANKLSADCLQLLLEYSENHADIKKILEDKDDNGQTCLHLACEKYLSADSLRVVLKYLSKHADIKKVLEAKNNSGKTCFDWACIRHESVDSVRLLISFFPSRDLCVSDYYQKQTPIECTSNEETKQLLGDPDCFEKCRLWLLRNHEDTFLYSLFPYSFEKTCHALKELKNGLQHTPKHLTIMLIVLMPSSWKFREAVDKTDSSAPMASYFDVVKKGDKKSDYNHWRRNIHLFREFYGQWPPSERKTASDYEKDASGSSCSIQ